MQDDLEYFRVRAAEEAQRAIAAKSPLVARAHALMAEAYASRIDELIVGAREPKARQTSYG